MPERPTIAFLDTVHPDIQAIIRELVPDGFRLVEQQSWDEAHRIELARRADYLLVWTGELSPAIIRAAERARLVQMIGQGLDRIDVAGARARGIPVANAGGANAVSVAEHTILLLLAVYRKLAVLQSAVRNGGWPNFEYRTSSYEVCGKRVGIVGLGNIGRKVAERLAALGCELAYYDVVRPSAEEERRLAVSFVPFADLLAGSDVVTLHVPLKSDTRGMIGRSELERMKPGAVLINTARGPVVDEAALLDALRSGHLAGAGLDVLAQEPPDPTNPLLFLENVVVTPHAAGATIDSARRTIRAALDNVARVESGLPPRWVAEVEG